jgi:hypothetical protein
VFNTQSKLFKSLKTRKFFVQFFIPRVKLITFFFRALDEINKAGGNPYLEKLVIELTKMTQG